MATLTTLVFSVDGAAFQHVDFVAGEEAISKLFCFRVNVRDPKESARSIEDLLGKPASLILESKSGEAFASRHGIVTSVSLDDQGDRAQLWTIYEIELQPEAAALTLGQDSRVFQEMSCKDIISDVLDRGGVAADHVDWKLAGSPSPRVYTAQIQESDWAFVERIAADEGISYYFANEAEATKLTFSDRTPDAPPIPVNSSMKAVSTSTLGWDERVVVDVSKRAGVTGDKVSLADYNPTKPKTKLEGQYSEGEGTYEIYDYPGRFQVAADGKKRAQNAVEALRSKRVTIHGRVHNLGMAPGHTFTITDHSSDDLNATFLCTEISWNISTAQGVQGTWVAIPADTVYREPSLERDREMAGPQTGIMVGPAGEELYTSDTGDIRVQFYWDRMGKKDETASTFMRVGQFALGGSMVRPRIGWDLLVEHHQGSADAPFVLSHLYDGEHPTPYALPGNKTRTSWQTATTPGGGSSNEVRFEDKKGSEEMFLNASKDMAVTVGDNKDKQVGVDHSHEIGANHQVKVGSNNNIGIKADQEVKIGATETLTVSGNRSTSIAGGDTASIGAARTVTAVGGWTLDADGGRSATVGASMMDIAALAVSRSVLGSCSVTVGAAWVSAAATGLANTTAGASSETVGGAKIQLGGGGVALNVKGALAETVGGAYLNLPGGNAGETAGGALTINVGGAFIANAPDILIEAESEISITCGGSSVTIKSSSIEVKSPSLASPGATIAKDGSAVHHNP